MSMSNEHYLETIRMLKEENETLKEHLKLACKGHEFDSRILNFERCKIEFFKNLLGERQFNLMNNSWLKSKERQTLLDDYNISSPEEPTHNPSTEEYDCIDVQNHERSELYRED